MDKEKAFFLRMLSDHLQKKSTIFEDNLDLDLNWETIVAIAKIHQVEGILYYQCKKYLPEHIKGRLAQLYAADLFYYSNRVKQYKEIAKRLNEEKIPFYTVKGMMVSQYYPVPALRTMGDCDIVVHSVDKSKTHDVMLSLGFENEYHQITEWTYYKNGMEFEIHDHLLYDEASNSKDSIDYTELAWEYAEPNDNSCYELDWNFHLVFLLLHLKKHILNSGVGFRQFMDLVVVMQNQELNWNWIVDALDRLEIRQFTEVCFTLCKYWFGIKMPLSKDLDMSFLEESTEKIFGNGVFGFEDERNSNSDVYNKVEKQGKIKTILRYLFPAYRCIRYVPYYSFVDNRPWLLPVAWIYRFIRSLYYGKGEQSGKLITTALCSDEKVEERKTTFQKWGL